MGARVLREGFDYPLSKLDPFGDHIDPPSVAVYETVIAKGPDWSAHPVLAEAWETMPDGLEWRVRLRPGCVYPRPTASTSGCTRGRIGRLSTM